MRDMQSAMQNASEGRRVLPRGHEAPGGSSAFCARLFLIVGVPALALLCFLLPPFEAPDEPAHFLRIVVLSSGHILPEAMAHDPLIGGGPSAGGHVDVAAAAMMQTFDPASQSKIGLARVRALAAISPTGTTAYTHHSNTAIYPPLLYLPATVAVAVARASPMPVLGWLYAGRLANALCGAALIIWALRRSRDAAPFLLLAAMLPVTLFQTASLSSDAALFPWTIVFCAMLYRMATRERMSAACHLALVVATLFIAVGKVAYLPLAILPAGARLAADRRWSWQVLAYVALAAISLLAWAAWAWIVRDKVFSIDAAAVDPVAQLRAIVTSPASNAGVLIKTIKRDLPSMLFGLVGSRLGWNELFLPKAFVVAAWLMLVASALPARRPVRIDPWLIALGVTAVTASYLAIYVLLYLQFNRIGAPMIEGVQSRYLTPLALALLSLTPRFEVGRPIMRRVLPAVGVWGSITALVTCAATLTHYWTM